MEKMYVYNLCVCEGSIFKELLGEFNKGGGGVKGIL